MSTNDEIIIYLYLDLKESEVPENIIIRIIEILEKSNDGK